MKYIDLINNFWKFYDVNKERLNTSDVTLYFVILRYCNKLSWINPFEINPFLMAEINPLSTNTYYKSLDKLNNLKLIKWNKGKQNVSNAKITILNFKTSVNNSIDNSIKFSINNSIGNNNKTIRQLDNNTNIPTFLKFSEYVKNKSIEYNLVYNESSLKQKYDSWIVNDWKDGNNNKIKNWKSKILNTMKFIFTIKEIKKMVY